jgi:hypothetical protein
MKKYSKYLTHWVEEFQIYNLKIKYYKGSKVVILDTISYRPDFIEAGPANKAERPTSILNTINI